MVHEKDAFVRGLHPDMQIKIKTLENFATLDMKGILDNTVRLEVAGVKSVHKSFKEEVNSVEGVQQNDIALETEKTLLARLEGLEEAVANISVASNSNPAKRRKRKDSNRPTRKGCWNCGETSHFLRLCPTRFCQACGERGHSPRDKKCSKTSS